jgi:hypothetical protein
MGYRQFFCLLDAMNLKNIPFYRAVQSCFTLVELMVLSLSEAQQAKGAASASASNSSNSIDATLRRQRGVVAAEGALQ